MGRRKETHTAKWNRSRQTTISDQGEVVLPLMSRGRPLELRETEEDVRLMMKSVEEARLRHATDQRRRQLGQRVSELQRQVWDRDRRIDQLDRRTKELEQAIDGAHAVAHKEQAAAPSPDPFALLEGPNATTKPH
jgi:hypothetical protein